jgi:hypothetical protein
MTGGDIVAARILAVRIRAAWRVSLIILDI